MAGAASAARPFATAPTGGGAAPLRRMVAALAGTVDAIDEPDGLARLSRSLARSIPCDSSSAILFHRDRPPDLVTVDYPTPVPQHNEIYRRAAYLLDPFHQAFLDGRNEGLWQIGNVVPGDFRHTAFFREYWRFLNQTDEVCFVVRTGYDAICLSMARSMAMPRYSPAERQAMVDATPLVVGVGRGSPAAPPRPAVPRPPRDQRRHSRPRWRPLSRGA
jgi:hypothetical protein